MTVYPLDELVAFARVHSPYYRELYGELPERPDLSHLPIIDQQRFWKANTLNDNRLLTSPHREGILFKSGGTTGNPKFSFFTGEEWATFCQVFGQSFPANGFKAGDRVVNLFYAGELYASFLFVTESLKYTGLDLVQLPVAGGTTFESAAHILEEQQANVVVGVPTTLIHLAEHLRDHGPKRLPIEAIYFGGESMYPDQREFLSQVFPGVRLASIGYASVDAGLLGKADVDCGPDEHRVFDGATLIEIVDEDTGEVIDEPGRAGKVLITNLTRKLMPVLRYPAGDRAEWVENPGRADRKFRLLGRSEEGARVGPMTLYYQDMHDLLIHFEPCPASSFQMRVSHYDGVDCLELRVAPKERSPEAAEGHTQNLIEHLLHERPMIAMLLERGFIHPVQVSWMRGEDLTVNPRTGKLRHVIDERKG